MQVDCQSSRARFFRKLLKRLVENLKGKFRISLAQSQGGHDSENIPEKPVVCRQEAALVKQFVQDLDFPCGRFLRRTTFYKFNPYQQPLPSDISNNLVVAHQAPDSLLEGTAHRVCIG